MQLKWIVLCLFYCKNMFCKAKVMLQVNTFASSTLQPRVPCSPVSEGSCPALLTWYKQERHLGFSAVRGSTTNSGGGHSFCFSHNQTIMQWLFNISYLVLVFLGNSTQTKVLAQFTILNCLLNPGEVWSISRVTVWGSPLPKSVGFAWVLSLVPTDTE